MTIEQIAGRSGYSSTWHSALERGLDEGYSDDFLTTVATILKMSPDETNMLFSLAPRRRGTGVPEQELRESRVILWTLKEISCPAFIIDSAWYVIRHNEPTAEWFPWVHGDRPNFMRWAFTAEARTILHNWDTEWGPQLWAEMQYALARQPDNAKLKALISGILESSHAARLIDGSPLSNVGSDGRRRRVKVPALGNRIRVVELIVLTPERAPASRVMMIVPLDDTQH
ncbi:hypothetical protein DMB66_58520 [Actinoplanes sp. ATCC 53533]|uniref:MmyB family transcriptional regulator n=1 Tax=Actinoplanes sp. ATCC 53533 TaxID=1288362 RepID=UPI000F77AABF|nr:helix-turn-helix domain-containing protein [Actinoplanes sp. ATCC 53533]RSM39107.1 hypothetical protein DMB66_58520 [Actinoplanes sp. ATCC 53533]